MDDSAQHIGSSNANETYSATWNDSASNPVNSFDNPSIAIENFNILGQSDSVKSILRNISVFGKFDAPVLVTGETGTGKELAARGLHYGGIRKSKPFVAINCATLTAELFASELFGHKRGAFTDAKKDKKGLLATANGGTLFLDEIDSLSLGSQAALLRFLQESEYRAVGSEEVLHADVRLIASANCDLESKIEQGVFRRDLYYRLYIFHIHMPALRDRKEDIDLLTEHFLRQFNNHYKMGVKSVLPELHHYLHRHDWPGNVRELENLLHRLYLLTQETDMGIDGILTGSALGNRVNHLQNHPAHVEDATTADEASFQDEESSNSVFDFSNDKRKALEAFESQYVKKVLSVADGNVTKAANLCGKERRAFGKLVKKYNIKKCVEIDFS